jgi:hypothetical protein
MSDSVGASECSDPSNLAACLLRLEHAQTGVVCGPLPDVHPPESATGSPSSGGHLVRAGFDCTPPARRRNEMHPEDLMKPDLFSGIVLLGGGGLIFVSLLLIVVTALTRA